MDRIIVIFVNIFLILFHLKGVKLEHMALTVLKDVVIVRIMEHVTLTLENVMRGCALSGFKSPLCGGK